MKVLILFCFLLTIIGHAFGQEPYEESYTLGEEHFNKAVAYNLEGATIFVSKKGFIQYLHGLKKRKDLEDDREELKNTIDTINFLYRTRDTLDISSVLEENNFFLVLSDSYFIRCMTTEKANVLDQRSNVLVKEIFTKEFSRTPVEGGCTYTGFYFYLPDSNQPFKSITQFIFKSVHNL